MRRIIGDPVSTIRWRCYVCIYISSDNDHPRRRGEQPRQKNLLHRPAELKNPPRHQIAHWAIIAAQQGGWPGETFFLSTGPSHFLPPTHPTSSFQTNQTTTRCINGEAGPLHSRRRGRTAIPRTITKEPSNEPPQEPQAGTTSRKHKQETQAGNTTETPLEPQQGPQA